MKHLKPLKYLLVFVLPILAYVSFHSTGWMTYLPLLEAFFLIPLMELFFKPDHQNHSEDEEQRLLNNRGYDFFVYLAIPVQFTLLVIFLQTIHDPTLGWFDRIGRLSSMGLLCGVLGINVAHELGHRSKSYEKVMSKMLLLTSMYMHFFIEHNRGHHTRVSTPDDPASARFGETLYGFWFRSIVFSYLSAWKIERKRLQKLGLSFWSFRNEMIQYQFIQVLFITLIVWQFGWIVGGYFLLAALIGVLLLETVNYIEHYGLTRQKKGERFERVMPWHSWNSDHVLGRLVLFELSRHSDHHYKASRKYQILRNFENSPQMPTGYPGMMLLAVIPPIWFRVMNGRAIRASATV